MKNKRIYKRLMLAAGAEAPSLGVKGCIMANPLVQNDGIFYID
jgi:hypothetical protein